MRLRNVVIQFAIGALVSFVIYCAFIITGGNTDYALSVAMIPGLIAIWLSGWLRIKNENVYVNGYPVKT